MARFAAFLDACVLVPITTCDTLLRMAGAGAFRPLWSEEVFDEAQRALGRIHPDIDSNRFRSRFRSMSLSFEDAMVTGWEPLVASIRLPDENDRHVVAAALVGRADAIVTENTDDFPAEVLEPLGLIALKLDEFLLDQFDLAPDAALGVIEEQSAAMINPPVDVQVLLERLSRSGAPRFAEKIREQIARSD
ncbi:PIN domain-containing protein [Populibacterium corticicola]|uniref:PIN domain-containing protein n=1 Tax=Populibacterium corticicola TaxID=1812826 RepID=A0ABW5XDB4_9MICO